MIHLLKCLLSFTVIVGLASCGSETPESEADSSAQAQLPAEIGGIKTGPWRVELEHPGGGLPFTLEIKDGPSAYFVNGPERMQAEEITIDNGTLRIRFPSYDSTFTASLQDDGTLAGEAVLTRRLGELKKITFPLTATYGQTWRHFKTQDENPESVEGTWDIELSNPFGGPARAGLGIFEQDGAIVTGTFLFPQGDYRWLQGEVKEGTLYLSSFDGGQGTVWIGQMKEDGTMEGLLHAKSYGFPPVPWTGKPDANATLPDANDLTKLKPGAEPFTFSLPNLNGDIVSLDDARFDDKVVLVTIGGTWCPTCHDEAAFLAPYYDANKDRGLEVVGLQFEYTDDLERNKRQIKAFKNRYDINYDMLIGGVFGNDGIAKALPMIDKLEAYPTTIFIDRSGAVRRIHTSFPGKATGKRHELYVSEFKTFLEELLNEPA